MLIEIQCENFSDFDPALGRYVECGEKIIVSDDKIGQLITCTKCHQQIEVPFDVGTTREPRDPSSSLPAGKRASQTASPTGSRSARARAQIQARRLASQRGGRNENNGSEPRNTGNASDSTPKKSRTSDSTPKKSRTSDSTPKKSRTSDSTPKKSRTRESSPKKSRTKLAATNDELTLAPPAPRAKSPRAKSDLMSMDFGDVEVETTLREDTQKRCKKCGNISEAGRCTVCKNVEPNFEKIHQPLEDIEIQIAGLQRWFCNTMSEGVSIKVLEYGGHILFGLLGTSLVFASVVSLIGFGLGPVGGGMLLLFVLGATAFYVGLIFKGHQFLRDPTAKLAWFQRPFWNLMLHVSRRLNWQAYDSRFKGRKIITEHDRGFGDKDIANLEGLKSCQVLDLQGTHVTDRGLLEIYRLDHLHCVVLRGTDVSHEGVFRLQQSFPRLWIWY